ncbi:hypothetical protein ACT8ZS_19975 [Paenibacillus sp. M.A.Huq-84]
MQKENIRFSLEMNYRQQQKQLWQAAKVVFVVEDAVTVTASKVQPRRLHRGHNDRIFTNHGPYNRRHPF